MYLHAIIYEDSDSGNSPDIKEKKLSHKDRMTTIGEIATLQHELKMDGDEQNASKVGNILHSLEKRKSSPQQAERAVKNLGLTSAASA